MGSSVAFSWLRSIFMFGVFGGQHWLCYSKPADFAGEHRVFARDVSLTCLDVFECRREKSRRRPDKRDKSCSVDGAET